MQIKVSTTLILNCELGLNKEMKMSLLYLNKKIESLEKETRDLKRQMKLREEESLMFLNCFKLIYKRTKDEELKRELASQIEDLHIAKKPQ